jgi:hypothetical protein
MRCTNWFKNVNLRTRQDRSNIEGTDYYAQSTTRSEPLACDRAQLTVQGESPTSLGTLKA